MRLFFYFVSAFSLTVAVNQMYEDATSFMSWVALFFGIMTYHIALREGR